ncbi:MAG: adenosine deaminase [Bdellovibrionales bacterium]|nr:adenosine deaminase [Bdellovibrionales bacterium]
MSTLTEKQIKELPKVELHRHLELSVRAATIKELAPQIGIELPDEETFKNHFLITEKMNDLGSVLNKFLDTQKLLFSEEVLERVAYEACEDAFHEGIKILELRYAPTFVIQGHDHLNFQSIHNSFVKGMQRAEKDFPMAVGLVGIIQRILPVEEAERVTHFVIENKDTFVGLDLADNEEGFDSKPFSSFFDQAKKSGLGITVHSGEANLPKAPRYVKDAIDYLGADRIGHGVQIYRDPEIIEYVKQKQVTLELCPTSNYLTNAVPSTKEHPIVDLMNQGVKVTINTDDPGIFGIDLNHEYNLLVREHLFTQEQFELTNNIAAKESFISLEKKQKVWPRKIN